MSRSFWPLLLNCCQTSTLLRPPYSTMSTEKRKFRILTNLGGALGVAQKVRLAFQLFLTSHLGGIGSHATRDHITVQDIVALGNETINKVRWIDVRVRRRTCSGTP